MAFPFIRSLVLGGVATLLVATSIPATAGNLSFLTRSPVSYFNDEDMRLLKEAVLQVLDDKDARAKRSWSNPATGSSGTVEARGAFKTAAGVNCKRVRVTNHANGVDGDSTYTVCQDADKDWAIDQSAKPG